MKRSVVTAVLAGAVLALSGPAYAGSRTGAGDPGGHLADESVGQAVSSASSQLFSGTGNSLDTTSSVVHGVGDSLS